MKLKIKPILKIHGGKQIIASWIASNFPENYKDLCYVEPYCGGASVFVAKDKSVTEVLNDKNLNLLEIYQCLRDESKEFIRRLSHFKYCEETFLKIQKKSMSEDYLERAVNDYVLVKMSRSELKKSFSKSGANSWKKSLQELAELSYRLQDSFIYNNKALDIIKVFNSENTLLYCDPPYLYENKTSKTVYSSEMDTNEHIQLSHALNSFKGKVVISGITSPLYNRLYKSWNMQKFKGKKTGKKTEVIWKNY